MGEIRPRWREAELTALMIAPDRELAAQFSATLAETRAFQILADLKSYPSQQTLDIRLRQLRPDVVLLDVATNLDTACDLIRFLASFRPATQVVGLHTENHSEAVLRTLRLGASEFLHLPFERRIQQEAIARIRRLRLPDSSGGVAIGKVVMFASAKPGSGASTLAVQAAFALRRLTGHRVLLVDLDTSGGTIAFLLKLHPAGSVQDVLERAGQVESGLWASLVAHREGIEVLAAPDEPDTSTLDPNRLHDMLELARARYDWVVLDGPAVPHRNTLLAFSESDKAFLLSTGELASLHLAHRAVGVLEQLGFSKSRFHVLVNRFDKKHGIGAAEIEKILSCPVHALVPNDYFSLHHAISLGQPLASDSNLHKAVDRVARGIIADGDAQRSAQAQEKRNGR